MPAPSFSDRVRYSRRWRAWYARTGLRAIILWLRAMVIGPVGLRVSQLRGKFVLTLKRGWITNAAGVPMRLDRNDPRACYLASQQGRTDPDLIEVWARLASAVAPHVVLDIGANYGEVILSAGHTAETNLVAFEPNPAVASCLQSSFARGAINGRVVVAAVAAESGQGRLLIDPRWSGVASLTAVDTPGSIAVPVVAVDDVLGGILGDAPDRPLLFKIDVEGGEIAVLHGMEATLAQASWAVGVCEFIHLGASELEELCRRFCTFLVRRPGLQFEPVGAARLVAMTASGEIFPYLRDVVLVRRGDHLPWSDR